MDRTPVLSSNIRGVGYDAAAETLELEFQSGAIYQYAGVPAAIHAALMAAQSKGNYAARYITTPGAYPTTKMPAGTP